VRSRLSLRSLDNHFKIFPRIERITVTRSVSAQFHETSFSAILQSWGQLVKNLHVNSKPPRVGQVNEIGLVTSTSLRFAIIGPCARRQLRVLASCGGFGRPVQYQDGPFRQGVHSRRLDNHAHLGSRHSHPKMDCRNILRCARASPTLYRCQRQVGVWMSTSVIACFTTIVAEPPSAYDFRSRASPSRGRTNFVSRSSASLLSALRNQSAWPSPAQMSIRWSPVKKRYWVSPGHPRVTSSA